ncbi:CRE-ELKS-1 protein [Caenorhabditis remanei]|uniref:CRE-ELKS-1 protein n=1 Tax=Caenorhabditis remanei TaxID=31234 RepID=E3N9S1_CAERE|nr:CRE-ELKS-1 protein [Caenorhabditis remanei]
MADEWPSSSYNDHHQVPGPSNYPEHSMAPGPAPYGRTTSVMNSTGRNTMGYPSGIPPNTSISAMSRRPLQRQHRSMDGLGVLDAYKDSLDYDTLMQPVGTSGKPMHQPSYLPLEISTSHHHHGAHPNQFTRGNSLALSNPIPTQNAFWQHNNSMTTTTAPGASQEYDMMQAGMSRNHPTNNMNLAREYEQLKIEYNTIMEKLNQTMNSIKTFWSPELKRERQMRRDEANRIAQLERIVQSGGGGISDYGMGSNEALQLRMELREREERIRQLTTALETGSSTHMDGRMDGRVRELEDTIMRLQDLLTTKETQAMMASQDPSGRQAIENALRRIDEKQARIVELEEELMRQRMGRSNQPRDFTDKNLSGHEITTMRMKMDRSEVELAEKKQELLGCQTRMQTAEETANEMRGHLTLLKDQLTNREQHNTLLQGDVDALRQKLDSKNKQLEQKDERIGVLERELSGAKADTSDKTELIRQTEIKTSQLIGRIDGLENTVREKEQELDRAKIRLLSHPDVVKEREMTEKIEQGERERARLQEHIDQVRRNSEKDHLEQQKSYQNELTLLRGTIENLQKELADRDILLESQNEKIGDMSRDLSTAKKRLDDAMVDKGTDELRLDVEGARNEVEKLLKMVHNLEKENLTLTAQCKQMSSDKRDSGGNVGTGTLTRSTSSQSNMHKRIEELEEALRESVSITAEREVHLSQQKHHLQQVSSQLNEARKEISDLRRTKQNLSETGDRDQIIRAIETERRQHLEQLFQLKQEALLAAISEKDTHLALLEKSRGPRDEIETIRRHKDALIRKLKQENERRALVAHPDPAISMNAMASVIPGAPLPAPIIPGTIGIPQSHQNSHQNQNHDDDADGIWA